MSVPLLANNDGHCISVMTMTLVLLPCAGDEGLHAAVSLVPLQARSQFRSLSAWPFTVAFSRMVREREQACWSAFECCPDSIQLLKDDESSTFPPRGLGLSTSVQRSSKGMACLVRARIFDALAAKVALFLGKPECSRLNWPAHAAPVC